MQSLEKQIQQAAQLICRARHAIVLTGAGISTPSGIPDFRSANSGLWNNHNPLEVASIFAFRQHPDTFYRWARPLAQKVKRARPNAAHYALAELEAAGRLKAIITQNIDGLHQAASSRCVYEVHGHNREMVCLRCYRVQDAGPIFDQFLVDGVVPHCECGGVLKPNVILFGEHLPIQILHRAKAAVAAADLLMIVGSSLEVAPISDLPRQAMAQKTKIVVINYQETYVDRHADLVIRHDLTEVLPKITGLVLN